MKLIHIIRKRRTIRSFIPKKVSKNKIGLICEAGRWAPSGLNNQPWNFIIVQNERIKLKIVDFTRYSHIVKSADFIILIFLDKKRSYHLIKDCQAIGACIENMLLCATDMGIGSCWIGQILNKKDKIREFFRLNKRYELMACLAFGYSKSKPRVSRMPLKKLILKIYEE